MNFEEFNKVAKPEHIHIYVRRSPNVYACADPDCTHWTYKRFLKGKRSVCATCHRNEIILTTQHLRRAKPQCMQCSQTRVAKEFRERQSSIEHILSDFNLGDVKSDDK